jgi:hypothetical protein
MNFIGTPRLATPAEKETMFGKGQGRSPEVWYRCDFILNGTSLHVHAESAAEATRLATKAVMALATPDPSSTSKVS